MRSENASINRGSRRGLNLGRGERKV